MLPLDCRVSRLEISATEDLLSWSEMIVTPQADLPVAEQHGISSQWTEAIGLRVEPQSADGSLCRRSPESAVFLLARERLVIIRAEGVSGLTG